MASIFQGIEVWTESCSVGSRVAFFDTNDLATAVLKQSLTGVESLTFSLARRNAAAAELIHGRIARVVWSDTTLDTEWRLSDDQTQSGRNDRGETIWTAQAMALDLARAIYVTYDSAGRPTFDFSATQLTATQWLAYVVTAAQAAPLPYSVSVGTVEFTNTFDLSGEFATGLEIVRAIQQPGRAPGDFVYRRNGTTDYKLDLLTSRGSTASTVRVQTARNLLENVRKRTLVNLGTKIVPRAGQGAAIRDLSQIVWKVASVDSGTTATLSDPNGGTAPGAFTDQLKNLYVARVASTFSSQQITASTGSQITVGSTAGWSSGDFVRLFTTSGSAGNRLVSISHPTRVLSPASSGYGPVSRILDMPQAVGDTNLVLTNPWMSTWTTAANPADSWGRDTVTGVTYSREATTKKNGTYAQKVVAAGQNSYTIKVYSPTATPYTTSGLRFSGHIWVYVEAVGAALQRYMRARIMKPDLSVSYADGDYLDPAEIVGAWTKVSVSNVDLSSATAGVVVAAEFYATNDPNGTTSATFYVDSAGLGESDVPISDVVYSGAIPMWQRANVLLNTISAPVAGYTLRLADLARLDTQEWSDEPLTLGGTLEVVDSDLSDTTSQRLVELTQNLLNPLDAEIVVQTPDTLLTNTLAGTANGSTITGATGSPVTNAPTTVPTKIADTGVTDVYTKAEIDAMLAGKLNIGGVGIGNGTPLTIGGVTYTALGTYQQINTGGAATQFATVAASKFKCYVVFGRDQTSGNDEFLDLVAVSTYGAFSVGAITSTDVRGSPRARTYSIAASAVKLALGGAGGNTYNITVADITGAV